MRKLFACFAVSLLMSTAPVYSAEIEKPQAIDGTTYAVIPGLINYINNTASFIRFFNGGYAATNFTLTIVNPVTSAQVGSVATISVPARAAKIISIKDLLGSSYANANVADGSAYTAYLQSSEPLAGYQHIVFNGNKNLFENGTTCSNLLNTATLAYRNQLTVLGLTTINLSSGSVSYPSNVGVHNYSSSSQTYEFTVINADTGEQMGDPYERTVGANQSFSIPFYAPANPQGSLQSMVGWQPTSSELWANVLITEKTGVRPLAIATGAISNTELAGSFNMSTACAITAPPTTTLTSTTTFDGVIAGIAGTSNQTGTFSIAVQATSSSSTAAVTTTGSLRVGSASAITLSGTYNPVTRALVVSGGGYTLTGAVMGTGTYAGTYTGPSSASGGVAAEKALAGTASRGYCGTFSVHTGDGDLTGPFAFVASGTNAVGGAIGLPDGSSLRITGTVTGTSLSGYTISEDIVGTNGTIGASSASGTISGGDASGTWTGTSCGSF